MNKLASVALIALLASCAGNTVETVPTHTPTPSVLDAIEPRTTKFGVSDNVNINLPTGEVIPGRVEEVGEVETFVMDATGRTETCRGYLIVVTQEVTGPNGETILFQIGVVCPEVALSIR